MTGITYQLFGNLIEEVNDFENVKSTNSLATISFTLLLSPGLFIFEYCECICKSHNNHF